jgi:pimeloyl-ACP methyl ester carboxylesterase
MVGHSMGGMLARVYAHNYPDEVAGLIQVDALHEERVGAS